MTALLLSHPVGNENSRNAAVAFDEAGLLAEFWTTVQWDDSGIAARLLPRSVRDQLSRRAFPERLRSRLRSSPWRELARQAAKRLGLRSAFAGERAPFSVDRIFAAQDRRVAKRVERGGIDAIYAYEDGALHSFAAAKRAGLRRLYELPIGYWRAARRIMLEEREAAPAWAATIGGLADSAEKTERKDAELALADLVVVPSSFVVDTLRECPREVGRIAVVPYGCPDPRARPPRAQGPLRVLFVGGLSQRKGISYLFRAMEELGSSAILTLIGTQVAGCADLTAALSRHRWLGSLPHERILGEMLMHDVLVLPTLFEGQSLAILEAMACGMPVVTTPNSGAADVIADGRDGFIVPIRDPAAIAERLARLTRGRDLLEAMSRAAAETARARSWSAYRARLLEAVAPAVGP